ncbi:MAG TPA: hypothetical protein VLF14_02210 [Candidatus Binatia bacterium]|nr:hypothetical protein [Candidatus Binatia bacterium]
MRPLKNQEVKGFQQGRRYWAKNGAKRVRRLSGPLRRKGPFAFVGFDVLVANGKDLRMLPLTQRKEILRLIVPKRSSVVLFSQHIGSHGRDFFAAVCAQDLEGIVAKRKDGSYDPTKTQWLKIKNRDYSQARDRHELFQQ